ncbi:MAG: hypothetical protein FWE04_08285 [Oscillospiraceae bacterium]|nr:hypothetical protein [Oscillospiraceae bacterium]
MCKRLILVVLALVMVTTLTGCFDILDDIFGGVYDTYDSYDMPDGVEISDHPLVGTWAWDGNGSWQYIFDGDGTGTRGIFPDIETFRWSIPEAGHITMNIRGGMREQWSYTIDGAVFTLDSRQVAGVTYSYVRIDSLASRLEQVDPDLVGTWVWDSNYTYTYVFYADGTGTRGFYPFASPFEWWVPDAGILMMDATDTMILEAWDYTISSAMNGEMFTIVSRGDGTTFSYIRTDDYADSIF